MEKLLKTVLQKPRVMATFRKKSKVENNNASTGSTVDPTTTTNLTVCRGTWSCF